MKFVECRRQGVECSDALGKTRGVGASMTVEGAWLVIKVSD